MAVKYFCEYRTLNTNELWKVTIDIPDYSGDPIRKEGSAGQVCIVEHNGGDKMLEKFAIPSSATITLLFDDPLQTRELQLLGDKTSQVRVYRNGGTQLYWQGYLISDGIQHPDSGVITPITINAIDMVEAANDIPFANISAEAITVDGQVGAEKSPLNWIRKCLINPDNIDNRLPIRWSCSLKNLQYSEDDFFAGRTGFIPNYDIFASSRQSTSVGWFLENIAKSADCLFFQYDGYWYLVSLVDLANNSTLDFYQIGGNDLAAKTATVVSLSLEQALPTKINENTYSMVQKPISKVKATYNHSMPSNIIPNGGFDITDNVTGKPLYWQGTESIVISSDIPINNRGEGRSLKANNIGLNSGTITFEIDNISSMPLDASVLFKNMQWGFTFLPTNYPTDSSGFISWVGFKPLKAQLSYTGYQNNILRRFYLNEFGYWDGRDLGTGLKIENVEIIGATVTVTFSGSALIGDSYNISYNIGIDSFSYNYDFSENMSLSDAMIAIASATGGANGTNTVTYFLSEPLFAVSASIQNTSIDPITIWFEVDGMKNNDIATIQFQSKGNQGRVLMPYAGVLNQDRALNSGKLTLSIIVDPGHEVFFDDVYMNVSDNKEFWEISDGGNDGKAEYELEISSSFSGFMTTSYMDNFAKADLSMIMNNGTDQGTLTDLFGKTALRFLSKPTSKIDTEVVGEIGLLKLLSYKGNKFIPLKSSINTETNSSKLTIFELNYDTELELTSAHRSNEEGESSSFSTGGYGGGSSGSGGGGAEFLFELGDVNLGVPTNGQALVYNSSTGKWINGTPNIDLSNYWTKIESDNRYQPLEDQRLSTSNKVAFYGINANSFITIPNAVSADAATNGKWQVYIDVAGTGGGGVAPPVVVNLTDLQDVAISGVTNGQALTYNSATGKWVNSSIVTDLSNYYTKSESDARFYPLTGNPSGFLTASTAGTLYEPIFSKNTAFNKNFGTSAGTVAEGNDSRINNGQTAYSWGNHASAGYALSNGSNASGTWGINISGSAIYWGGQTANFSNEITTLTSLGGFGMSSGMGYVLPATIKTFLGLPSTGGYDLQSVTDRGATTNKDIITKSVHGEYFLISLGNGFSIGADNTLGGLYIYDLTSNQYRFTILNNGNVGLGTTTPAEKLDVNGKIKSNDTIYAPTLTATVQQNIPVKSGGVATGSTFEIFVEL